MDHRRFSILSSYKSLLFMTQDFDALSSLGKEPIIFSEINVCDDTMEILDKKLQLCINGQYVQRVLPITCDVLCFILREKLIMLNPNTSQFREVAGPFIAFKERRLLNITFDYVEEFGMYYIISLCPNDRQNMNGELLCWKAGESCCSDVNVGNSVWSSIDAVCPRYVRPEGVFVGRKVFWLIYRDCDKCEIEVASADLLVCLDMESEIFSIYQCPDCHIWKNLKSHYHVKVLNLMGRLCLTDEHLIFTSYIFHLWGFVGEDNVHGRWTKICNVNLDFPLSMRYGPYPISVIHGSEKLI